MSEIDSGSNTVSLLFMACEVKMGMRETMNYMLTWAVFPQQCICGICLQCASCCTFLICVCKNWYINPYWCSHGFCFHDKAFEGFACKSENEI